MSDRDWSHVNGEHLSDAPADYVSDCCCAGYHVEGKTTHYYVCDECGAACDLTER